MKKYGLILQLFIFQIIFSQSQKDDYFPLSVGNSWTYDYSTRLINVNSGPTSDSDSGTAIYKIIYKSETSDSTVWQIEENREIIHTWLYFGPGPGGITKQYIKDTSSFALIEYHQGNHRMIRVGITDWKSVFHMNSDYSDSISLFRYLPFTLHDTISFTTHSPNSQTTINIYSTTYQRGVGITKTTLNDNSSLAVSKHSLRSSHLTLVKSHENLSYLNGFKINQNYPNPFNPKTVLSFDILSATKIEINVYDIMGRHIETLYNNSIAEGPHSIIWNAKNRPSGIYLCVFKSNGISKTVKLVLNK